MRVAWKRHDEYWFASIGPCQLMLRPMHWSDVRAREHREAVVEDRAWVYGIRHYPDRLDLESRVDLAEGVFEVTRRAYDGGVREAQERAVEIAREFAVCRRERQRREAPEAASIEWLENRLLETLRDSYKNWRESVARIEAQAAAGDRSAQEALYYSKISRRPMYPEPKWTTARLAAETAQYSLPDDLDALSDKRFYQAVYNTLERLRRRGLLVSSTGVDDRGREARLWEPA
jgi:hypothetical protein